MTPVASVRGLDVSFPGLPTVVGVDVDLLPGTVTALAGESGAGKPVTLAAMLGLLPRSAVVSGRLSLAPTTGGARLGAVHRAWQRDSGAGVMAISHHQTLVARWADRVVDIEHTAQVCPDGWLTLGFASFAQNAHAARVCTLNPDDFRGLDDLVEVVAPLRRPG